MGGDRHKAEMASTTSAGGWAVALSSMNCRTSAFSSSNLLLPSATPNISCASRSAAMDSKMLAKMADLASERSSSVKPF